MTSVQLAIAKVYRGRMELNITNYGCSSVTDKGNSHSVSAVTLYHAHAVYISDDLMMQSFT